MQLVSKVTLATSDVNKHDKRLSRVASYHMGNIFPISNILQLISLS